MESHVDRAALSLQRPHAWANDDVASRIFLQLPSRMVVNNVQQVPAARMHGAASFVPSRDSHVPFWVLALLLFLHLQCAVSWYERGMLCFICVSTTRRISLARNTVYPPDRSLHCFYLTNIHHASIFDDPRGRLFSHMPVLIVDEYRIRGLQLLVAMHTSKRVFLSELCI